MSDVSDQGPTDKVSNKAKGPIQLVLVDEDPVFRLGLKVWLEQ